MKKITIKCPECREVIEIDGKTGKVLKHHPEVKAKSGDDFLKERLRSLDLEKSRREAIVAESTEKEKKKKDTFGEIFKKVKKTAGEGPVTDRPIRDIDLD